MQPCSLTTPPRPSACDVAPPRQRGTQLGGAPLWEDPAYSERLIEGHLEMMIAMACYFGSAGVKEKHEDAAKGGLLRRPAARPE